MIGLLLFSFLFWTLFNIKWIEALYKLLDVELTLNIYKKKICVV